MITPLLESFSTSALAGRLFLELDWLQFSSGRSDSSRYSGRSQQYCRLYDFDSSSNLQLFQSPYQGFGNRSKRSNY